MPASYAFCNNSTGFVLLTAISRTLFSGRLFTSMALDIRSFTFFIFSAMGIIVSSSVGFVDMRKLRVLVL